MIFKNFIYILQTFVLYVVIRTAAQKSVHGRYTRDILYYKLVIPRKLNSDGGFQTFVLPHFFEHRGENYREKRSAAAPLKYGLTFEGKHHHVDLWPNHDFLSPDAVFEHRNPNLKVQSRQLERPPSNLCYYTGTVRGEPQSKVAISTCDGLAGYFVINGRRYFIEPVEGHSPNQRGQLLHLMHDDGKPETESAPVNRCGTDSKWEDAWKNRFINQYRGTDAPVVRRGLDSVHRYLETLIVADKKFLEFHKGTDMNTYILTVMNMVSNFYHDASSGNQMDVVVVRVMLLEKEEEEIDLTISANSDDTLASFCKWQQTVNPKDIKHPNHHDIAVLLTRYDICADNLKSCGLMGLAYVASACTGDKPCAINEDSGLILGIVVAHEMGHVMGCSHDKEDESGCKPQADDKSYYIMSPYVHLHTTVWSTCSRGYITALFDNNLGECLNDEPEESIYKDVAMLPGVVYDALYQCNQAFPGSKVCKANRDKFCEQLLCRTSPTSCMSNGEPPADGTKCAENMWCYNKKCVEMGERPKAVSGGWGAWGPWSDCSRTCGAGVSYSERDCNNPKPAHKGRYCLGERKKIKICNTTACPAGSKQFRAAQCSEYDGKPFHDKTYTWSPYYVEDEPCSLYCLNNENVFSKLSPRAKDGTKCKRGTKDMCISGTCKKVGCDFVIDSDAVEDDCGICKGDGTQCKIVEQTYQGNPSPGYAKVDTIPKGARNILIQELGRSENTMSLGAVDGKKYFLNGEFTEQQDGPYMIGGAEGVYSHTEPSQESVIIHGPLLEDVIFYVVYYKPTNVGYRYKYAEPSTQTNYQPKYHWEYAEWEDCSARCGGGVQLSNADCLEEKTGKVTPTFCTATDKPQPRSRTCNEEACKTKWRTGKWSKCSACKFQSGVRMREVECVREAKLPGTEDTLVDDDQCTVPKPGTRELCNSKEKCSKIKREADSFSDEQMQHLWFQTFANYMQQDPISLEELSSNPRSLRQVRRAIIKSNKRNFSPSCSGSGAKPAMALSALKVGTIVDDVVAPEEVKLIEVPLKQSGTSLNLTDAAFESLGDKLPDTLDICKEKVVTGNQAAERLKEFAHKNKTSPPTNNDNSTN